MLTSSPYFSKKPRSTAIGNASMSTAFTMPTLSFTRFVAWASASDGNSNREQSSSAIRFIMVSLRFQWLNTPHPVRTGYGRQINSFHPANFKGIRLVRTGDSAVGLKPLKVKTLRGERQRNQYVYLLRLARNARDLMRCSDRQPNLPCDIEDRDCQQDVKLSRLEHVTQHGSG